MNQISSKRIPFIKINSISSRQIVVFVHWEKIILLPLLFNAIFLYGCIFLNSILMHTHLPGYEFNWDVFYHNFLLSYIFFHDEYTKCSNEFCILYNILFYEIVTDRQGSRNHRLIVNSPPSSAIFTETFFLTAKQHQNQKIKLGSSGKSYENINLIFFKKKTVLLNSFFKKMYR